MLIFTLIITKPLIIFRLQRSAPDANPPITMDADNMVSFNHCHVKLNQRMMQFEEQNSI